MTTYLLGAIVRLWRRLSKGGIDKWERGRARSIAAASAPLHGEELPPEDLELVEAHHEIVVEWRQATDEQPIVRPPVRRRRVDKPPSQRQLATMRARVLAPVRAFAADPLTAPLPDLRHIEEPVLFGEQTERWFSLSLPFVAPPVEPVLREDVTFTGSWNGDARRELRALLAAEATAASAR